MIVLWTVQSPRSGCLRTYRSAGKAERFLALMVKDYGIITGDVFYVRSLMAAEVSARGWTLALARAAVDEGRKGR